MFIVTAVIVTLLLNELLNNELSQNFLNINSLKEEIHVCKANDPRFLYVTQTYKEVILNASPSVMKTTIILIYF